MLKRSRARTTGVVLLALVAALMLTLAGSGRAARSQEPQHPGASTSPSPLDGLEAGFELLTHELAGGPPPSAEDLRAMWAGSGVRAQRIAAPGTIFPPDDRVAIIDTTKAPWRAIVHLIVLTAPRTPAWECTGAMINANVVLTAAHCLLDDETRTYPYSVVVVPGDTEEAAPFGTSLAKTFSIPKGFADSGARRFDFGLVHLEGTPFSNRTEPYFTVAALPNAQLADPKLGIATAGYPGDKPFGTMWSTATYSFTLSANAILTEMDAYPGQSGSPVYTIDDSANERLVVGVFTAATPDENIVTRITSSVLSALRNYCETNGCTFTAVDRTAAAGPTGTATPPSPTATSPRTPSPTPRPTVASVRPALGSGTNTIVGPLSADVPVLDYLHCLPSGSWSAIYVWDTSAQGWRHYFAGVPSYVNGVAGSQVATISKGSPLVLVMNSPVPAPRLPDAPALPCQ